MIKQLCRIIFDEQNVENRIQIEAETTEISNFTVMNYRLRFSINVVGNCDKGEKTTLFI